MRDFDCLVGTFQVIQQFSIDALVTGRNQNKCQDIPFVIRVAVQTSQRLDKYVQSFVFKFVTSTDSHDQGIFSNRPSQKDLSHFQQFFPSLLTFHGIIFLAGRETVLESIRCYEIHLLTQKVLTLFRCNVTDRREAIRPLCRLTFQGLFGIHPETMGRFPRVILFHRVIKGQAVPGNTTS